MWEREGECEPADAVELAREVCEEGCLDKGEGREEVQEV